MFKLILNIFLIILAVIFQVSFLNSLTQGLTLINLPLIIIILLIFFSLFKWAWLWTLGTGILLDFFSFLHSGQTTLSLLLVFLIIYLLLTFVFTQRSLYSLIFLGVLATAFYQLSLFSFNKLFYSLGFIDYEIIFSSFYLKQLGWQILVSLVVFCLILLILLFLLKKRLVSVK